MTFSGIDNISKKFTESSKALAKGVDTTIKQYENRIKQFESVANTAADSIADAQEDASASIKKSATTSARAMREGVDTSAEQLSTAIGKAAKLIAAAAEAASKSTKNMTEEQKRERKNLLASVEKLADSMSRASEVLAKRTVSSSKQASENIENSVDDSAKDITKASETASDTIGKANIKLASEFDKQADAIEARADKMGAHIRRQWVNKFGSTNFATPTATTAQIGGEDDPTLANVQNVVGGITSAVGTMASLAGSFLGSVVSVTGTVVKTVASAVVTITSKVASGVTTIIGTIGNISVKAAEVSAAVVTSATVAAAALGKLSLDEYGDFEQLAGGIETLFGKGSDAYNTVMSFARDAYSTVQMSENEYMQNVTSFAATLLQTLDADTAANKADKAMRQIADNANKMGTSIDTVAYAYKGLAKNNATMLDNLQLGYGGTNAELARLINDSGVLNGELEATADNVSEIPFATVIDAIGVIQDRLNMTGVSAEEAAHTIQGSIASLRASWKNLLAGMGDPEADIDELTAHVLDSVDSVANNVLPAVGRIVTRASESIKSAAPRIRERISSLITDTLPALVDGGITIAQTIGGVLIDTLPETVEQLLNGLTNLLTRDNEEFIRAFVDMLVSVTNSIATHAPTIITAWYSTIATVLDEALSQIANDPQAFAQRLVDIIAAIGEGMVSVIETVATYAPTIIDGIIEVFTRDENIERFRALGGRFIDAIAMAFDIAGEDGGISGTKLGQKLVDLIEGIGNFFADNIGSASTGIGGFITSFVEVLTNSENSQKLKEAGGQILAALGLTEDNIRAVLTWAIGIARSWIDENKDLIKEVFTEVGKLMWMGIWDGLGLALQTGGEMAANGVLESIWGGIGGTASQVMNWLQYTQDPEGWQRDHPGAKSIYEGAMADLVYATTNSEYEYGNMLAGPQQRNDQGIGDIVVDMYLDDRKVGESTIDFLNRLQDEYGYR